MRVAHICESFVPGGIESLILDLCGAMSRAGVESGIFFLYGENGVGQTNKLTPPVPIRMRRRLRIDPLGLLRLAVALRRWSPDIIHCHGYYAAAAALLLRTTSFRRPMLYTVHADIYRGLQSSDQLIRWVARASDCIVAVSYKTADSVEKFTDGKVQPCVVWNGVDLDRLTLPANFGVGAKRRTLGLNGGELLIVSVAALNRQKDHCTLLRAFGESLSRLGDAYLLLIGEGSQRTELMTISAGLGLANRVLFLGRRDDVYEILSASDMFVLSTHNEGLPISILEACCSGLPVVATEVSGLNDLRDAGLNLVLSKKEDVSSLGDSLISLADPVRRQTLGEELRKAARKLFSITHTSDSYLSLYRELVGNPERNLA